MLCRFKNGLKSKKGEIMKMWLEEIATAILLFGMLCLTIVVMFTL
jgi:hypothetical protein